ncbi:Uncharacterised protein [Chlamydia trachomatis]|nr:Uncharacterised protein [Chlamydia trachomatis]
MYARKLGKQPRQCACVFVFRIPRGSFRVEKCCLFIVVKGIGHITLPYNDKGNVSVSCVARLFQQHLLGIMWRVPITCYVLRV